MALKGSPTKEEAEWMAAVVDYGCIACFVMGKPGTPCEVHHMLDGGRRRGHMFTIGLCVAHHRGGRNDAELVSRHPYHREFERRYGDEQSLLEKTRRIWESRKFGKPEREWWWDRPDLDMRQWG